MNKLRGLAFGSVILISMSIIAGCGSNGVSVTSSRHSISIYSPSKSTPTPRPSLSVSVTPPRPSSRATSTSADSSSNAGQIPIPGLGMLPLMHFPQSQWPFAITVTQAVVPASLTINGQLLKPPTAQSIPVIVTVVITPTPSLMNSPDSILAGPPFQLMTMNTAGASQGGQIQYFSMGSAWIADTPTTNGQMPRIPLGEQPVTIKLLAWVEKPSTNPPKIAVLWTATGKPDGVIRILTAQNMNRYAISTS